MLDTVHADVWVDGRRDRVAGINGRVLRDRDVDDRRGEKWGVVIYILDQEPDLDQPEHLVGQNSHLHLVEAAVLAEDAGTQLLAVDAVGGREDLPRVLLHPHQGHVPSLVHQLELQRGGQGHVGVQCQVEILEQVANEDIFRQFFPHSVILLLRARLEHDAGQQDCQEVGSRQQVHLQND